MISNRFSVAISVLFAVFALLYRPPTGPAHGERARRAASRGALPRPAQPSPEPTIHHHFGVMGRVTDGIRRRPIKGAEVGAASCAFPDLWRTDTTDIEGRYSCPEFTNTEFIDCHTLKVVVEATGYLSQTIQTHASSTNRGQIHVDFQLLPVGGSMLYVPLAGDIAQLP